MGMELFQPSLTLSIRHCRCVAPRIAKTSADGTIRRAMSRITLVSFRFRIVSQVEAKRSSRKSVSSGYLCSCSSKALHQSLLIVVTPRGDGFIENPLVASTVSYSGFLYLALFCSRDFGSPWSVELGVAESTSEFFLLLAEMDLFRASMFSMSLPCSKYCRGHLLFTAQYEIGCSLSSLRLPREAGVNAHSLVGPRRRLRRSLDGSSGEAGSFCVLGRFRETGFCCCCVRFCTHVSHAFRAATIWHTSPWAPLFESWRLPFLRPPASTDFF